MHWQRLFAAAAVVAMLFACTQTQQAGEVKESGFLHDYSKLKKGKEGQALLVYQNPAANWASYDKILLDPVQLWKDPGTSDLSGEDRQRLVNNFHKILYDRLSKDFQMVKAPEPNTLRMQVAITKAEQSDPVLDTVSTVVPQMLIVGTVAESVTGTTMFGGAASAEARVTDAETGEILFEAVDERIGKKDIAGATDSWADVNAAMKYWADQAAYRLCELREKPGCVQPEA